MKIGVIFVAWQSGDLLSSSLLPWINARKQHLGGHDYTIAAVSVPFEGFPQEELLDSTMAVLHTEREQGEIDYHLQNVVPMKETEARGAALKWLVEQGCDVTWQADADEFPTPQQIEGTLRFFETRPHVAWARGSLRNYVFDRQTYLVEPFTPPRLHRTRLPGGWVASAFWDDNNVLYFREGQVNERREIRDVDLPHVTVPKRLSIRHESWLNDSRSRRKIAYQNARVGWQCSFDWDDARGGLIWRDGQPIPETARD